MINNHYNEVLAAQPSPASPPGEVPPGWLRITGPLTVQTVEDLRARLLELGRQAQPAGIHLGAVDVCDCAGLELLCAAAKSARLTARALQIAEPSPAVLAMSREIGLDPAAWGHTRHET
jgi:anti-anti-sigma regulatory factor